jgi:hypothetical protein
MVCISLEAAPTILGAALIIKGVLPQLRLRFSRRMLEYTPAMTELYFRSAARYKDSVED